MSHFDKFNSQLPEKGGNDKMVIVFDNSSEQIVASLKGHTKKITQTIYHPDEVSYTMSPC